MAEARRGLLVYDKEGLMGRTTVEIALYGGIVACLIIGIIIILGSSSIGDAIGEWLW